MLFIRKREGVMQNLGWLDRTIRVVLSGMLLGIPWYFLEIGPSAYWFYPAMLVAVYPLLTGIMGVDPLYNSLDLRSCDTSERNQCGTFPFEVDAALGHKPKPFSDIDHSLEHSRHSV